MTGLMLSNNINHYDKAFQEAQRDEQRKGGRFATSSVWSGLGELLDLSGSGALIIKRRMRKIPKEKVFAIQISYEEIKVAINARVVRDFKKKGIGHLVAVEFIDLTEEQGEMLREIVRNSRSWRLFDFTEIEAA